MMILIKDVEHYICGGSAMITFTGRPDDKLMREIGQICRGDIGELRRFYAFDIFQKCQHLILRYLPGIDMKILINFPVIVHIIGISGKRWEFVWIVAM